MCERLGVLPNPGGLLQQDRNHLKKMQKVMQAIDRYKQAMIDKQEAMSKSRTPENES